MFSKFFITCGIIFSGLMAVSAVSSQRLFKRHGCGELDVIFTYVHSLSLSLSLSLHLHTFPIFSPVLLYLHFPGCTNTSHSGLPPYHPLVASQGFDPAQVDAGLRADAASIIAAGYNLRVVLMGPEVDTSVLQKQIRGHNWDGTGVGYGVRGSRLENLTVRFTGGFCSQLFVCPFPVLLLLVMTFVNEAVIHADRQGAELDIIDLYRREAPQAPIVFDYSFTTAEWAIERRFPLEQNCTGSPGTDLVSVYELYSLNSLLVCDCTEKRTIGFQCLL